MLIGLLQSPSSLDPFVNPAAAKTRRNVVLQNMVDNGKLSAADGAKYQASRAGPVQQQGTGRRLRAAPLLRAAIKNVGFFCDYAINWLQTTGGLSKQTIETGGLKIVTSLNVQLQNSGQQAVWNSGLDPKSPTALVMPSVDPEDRAGSRSMITSRHYGVGAGETTVPLFTSAYAGAGSTYKYFTALTALKLGVQPDFTLTTGSSLHDEELPDRPRHDAKPIANAGNYRATLPLSGRAAGVGEHLLRRHGGHAVRLRSAPDRADRSGPGHERLEHADRQR